MAHAQSNTAAQHGDLTPAGLPSAGAGLAPYRGMLLAAALITMIAPLNSTVLALALPAISAEFAGGNAGAQKIVGLMVTAYLMIMAALQPFAGALGDRVGRRRLVLSGLALFGAASLGAAWAASLSILVAARIVQALTAAATLPNVIALLRTHLPDVLRGKASGVIGAAAAIAAAIGPALGGVLAGAYGWRATFYVNVPLVAAGLLLFARIAAVDGERPVRPRQMAISAWRGTLLDARLFGATTAAIALSNMSMYVILLAIPVLLSGHGSHATRAGVILASLSVSTALSTPLGGQLADRRGRRLPVLMGMITLAAGTTLVAAGQNSIPALVIGLLFSGVGLGLAGAGMQAAAMESVTRAAAGLAAGVSSASRYIGSITGSLLWAAVFLASPRMGDALWMSTAAAVLAVAAALAMRRR